MFWSNLEVITFAGSRLRLGVVRRTVFGRRAVSAHENRYAPELSRSEPSQLALPLPRCWTRKQISSSTVIHGNAPRAEVVGDHRLVATLVLHQVRPGNRSPAVDAGPRNHFPREPKTGAFSVTIADIGSPCAVGSTKRVAIAEAGYSDPVPTPIETLFSELARRRLRNFAIREKP
jgi:hypothetical protein